MQTKNYTLLKIYSILNSDFDTQSDVEAAVLLFCQRAKANVGVI